MENKERLINELNELKLARKIIDKLILEKKRMIEHIDDESISLIPIKKTEILDEKLYSFMDNCIRDNGFGYFERVPLYNDFVQLLPRDLKNKITPQKFKLKLIDYCMHRDYYFNPKSKINDTSRKRIMKQSQIQVNKRGHYMSVECFYITDDMFI